MPIDRCYCREIPFAALLELARRDRLDSEELCASTGAGTGCGLCRSYLRVVLATGRTSLPVLNDEEVDRLCTEACSNRAAEASTGPAPRPK